MLPFVECTVYQDGCGVGRQVFINGHEIVAIEQQERRPIGGFYQPVAIVSMTTGQTHVVYDYDRKVSRRLAEVLMDIPEADLTLQHERPGGRGK